LALPTASGVVWCPHGAVQRHSEATCSENTDADVGGAPQTSVSRKQSEQRGSIRPRAATPPVTNDAVIIITLYASDRIGLFSVSALVGEGADTGSSDTALSVATEAAVHGC
jgi:hypothetical protein